MRECFRQSYTECAGRVGLHKVSAGMGPKGTSCAEQGDVQEKK